MRLARTLSVALLSGSVLGAVTCSASFANATSVPDAWFQVTELPRHASRLVYDPVRDRLIAYGGRGLNATYSDLRALDLAGDAGWSRLDDPATLLPEMVSPAIAYDPATDRLVFAYDLDSSPKVGAVSLSGAVVWTEITPSGSPPPRRGSMASVYDPVANRIVFFGGSRDGTTYFNDVWALNLGPSPSWQQLLPDGVPPTPRESALVYDTFRHKIVMIGGYGMASDPFAPPGPLTDVWRLTLDVDSDWVPLATSGAFPGSFGTLTYDAGHDRVLMLGTVDQGGSHALSLGTTPTWTLVPGLPASISGFGSCLDPTRNLALTFGGATTFSYDTFVPSVWQFDLASSEWSLRSGGPASSNARKSGTSVYDPVRDRLVVFQGTSAGAPIEVRSVSMATGEWENLLVSHTLPRLASPVSMVGCYRPTSDQVVLYGGFTQGGVTALQLWSFAYDERTWTPITLSTPARPPVNGSIAYDPYHDLMVGFFGDLGVWVLPFTGSVGWQPMATSGTPPPSDLGYVGVYDAVHNRYLITGRPNPSQAWVAGTWALAMTSTPTWSTLLALGDAPIGAVGPSVYDPLNDRVLSFDGGGTYALDLDGVASWQLLDPLGARPESRQAHSVAYDPRRSALIALGGEKPLHLTFPIDDLWELTPRDDVHPGIAPGADVVWSSGTVPVHYGIINPYPFAVDVPYRLVCERNWPGYPLLDNVHVPASSTFDLVLNAPVPDTAAAGTNTITFTAIFQQTGFRAEDTRRLVDLTTPARLSVTRVESEPDVVRLWWFGAEAEGDAIVERLESGSAWRAIGAASAPGPGSYSFEDRDVTPGREYVYRLQVTRSGTTLTSDETRVVVPALHDLALALASGNPSRRLGVRFALPDAAPARLELFDVSGRRRYARDVGAAGAGTHDEAIEAPGLSPGVYVIRLTRGAQVRSARAVLVR